MKRYLSEMTAQQAPVPLAAWQALASGPVAVSGTDQTACAKAESTNMIAQPTSRTASTIVRIAEGTELNRFCRAQPSGPVLARPGGARRIGAAGTPAMDGTGSPAASEISAVECDMA